MTMHLYDLAPITAPEWEGFHGAGPFPNGDRPLAATVFALDTEARVIIAADGVCLVVDGEEVARRDYQVPPHSALAAAAFAAAALQEAWLAGTVRASLLRRHGWTVPADVA